MNVEHVIWAFLVIGAVQAISLAYTAYLTAKLLEAFKTQTRIINARYDGE